MEKNIKKFDLVLSNGNNFQIAFRKDGFLFATAICNLVVKPISQWFKLKKIKELKNEKPYMFEIYKGGNDKNNQGTWLHRDVINDFIDWCIPELKSQISKILEDFNLISHENDFEENEEVSSLLYKIKNLEIELETKTKTFETEIQKKNKELEFLKIKNHRIQQREKCPNTNVIYIITNETLKKEKIFLFGKAVNLEKRLTTYNKSLEHEIIFQKSFKDIYHLNTAEIMIFYKLNKFRDKFTRKEKFFLPEDKEISLFTNVVQQTHEWFYKDLDVSYQEKIYKIYPTINIDCDRNVVYLLSSYVHLQSRKYIIGKSKYLYGRLSGYNKGIDHEVIYYVKCKNKYQMDLIESMILYKLDDFRERANRDRFILPEDKDVFFFIDIFDEALKWFDDVDENLEIIKTEEEKIQDRKNNKETYRELNKEKLSLLQKEWRDENHEDLLVKQKNYRETHKEQISNTKKEWYDKNKEKTIERVKKNYENNKQEKIEKVKEYASKNKEKIKLRQSKKMVCECGLEFRKYALKKHLSTTVHQERMKIKEENENLNIIN
jgi:hypothetical protein